MANIIAEFEDRHSADAVVIDFGGGGTGLKSIGNSMGRKWTLVNSSEKPPQEDCLNTRSWMWLKFKEWLMNGGSLPTELSILRQAGYVTYWYTERGSKLQIEGKDSIREKIGESTDFVDALCLTFCVNPQRKVHAQYLGSPLIMKPRNESPAGFFAKRKDEISRFSR
jgi:hypothetical protein